jgi:mannose-6-phosphate isomerase-like protein (cupin superfamily)
VRFRLAGVIGTRYRAPQRAACGADLDSFTSQREITMNRCTTLTLSTMALLYAASSGAVAQTAPPSYQGDPDVYKVIFEDQNFRVILANRKKGVHDKVHGHPIPSVIYFITDCTTKQYAADGKTAEATVKAGTSFAVPITASHSAENTGAADCQQLFVERK